MQQFTSKLKNRVRDLINKSGLCSLFNLTVTKKFHGKTVRIPIIKGFGLDNLTMSEIWMLDLLKYLLKLKSGMFIDVGVNIGQTLIKLKCVNREIRYIGFEPNPACVFYANELIKENKFLNCTLLPVALFTVNDILELELFCESEMDSSASLINNFRPTQNIYRTQYTPAFTFEHIAQTIRISEIGIIKIDVEGAELEVIKSLQKAISSHRPPIVIEILPVYRWDNKTRKDRQDKIEKILCDLNYSIFRVMKTKNGAFDGLLELSTLGVHSDLNQCDYVFVPFELKAELNALIALPKVPTAKEDIGSGGRLA
jgi:FkbM family methyltransferase